MNRKLGFVLIVSLFFGLKLSAASHLSARLIVTGPGDLVYSFWGHVGIAIKNSRTEEDTFYDFGNFSFQAEKFYRNFAMGRLLYAADTKSTELFLGYLRHADRNVKIYPLNLRERELEELDEILRFSVRPENSEFLYDYFLENCSTKIRDILNMVTNGALKEASDNVPSRNFRYYARVGAAPSLFMELLLHFLLGPMTDRKISQWDEMFLPESIPPVAENLIYKGKDSVERRLLGESVNYVVSSRDPVPLKARLLWPGMLIMGLVMGFIWNWAGWNPGRNPLQGLKLSLRVLIILIIAVPGAILFFISMFTNHVSAHGNLNVWPTLPTVIINLVFIGLKKKDVLMSWVWTLNLAGLVAAMLGWFFVRQDAYAFWVFYTPLLILCSRPGLWFFTHVRNRILTATPIVQEGISN